ncbi:MAG: DUF616 domain-containing protein [Fibrobacter sp.]|nr:DUF616 domain-containing protein [Fibrobacter sp.]
MNKIAIYTVVTGGYDKVKQPLVIDDRFDYILFTDVCEKTHDGIWSIRKIVSDLSDKQLLSRYPKLNPVPLLNEYEYSVYMDANIQIVSANFYERIIQLILQDVKLAGIKHQSRNCLYEEGFRILISFPNINRWKLLRQMAAFKKDGFPYGYGMYEANVIFRSHKNDSVASLCQFWWNTYKDAVRRDQLCYSYVLWKHNFKFCYLLPENENAMNSSMLNFYEHPNKRNIMMNRSRKIIKFAYPVLFFFYRRLIELMSTISFLNEKKIKNR